MTQRTLTLRYIISKQIIVDVPDDVFTEADIERIAQLNSEQNHFDDCNDADWEWDVKPRPITRWDCDNFLKVDDLVFNWGEPIDLALISERG